MDVPETLLKADVLYDSFIFMPVDAQPTYIRCGGRHFYILFTLNIDCVATEQKFEKDLRQYLVDLDFFYFSIPNFRSGQRPLSIKSINYVRYCLLPSLVTLSSSSLKTALPSSLGGIVLLVFMLVLSNFFIYVVDLD